MSATLPSLRLGLDVTPSPAPDRPGLVISDRFRYSDCEILVPSAIAPALACFDGHHDARDLQRVMSHLVGRPVSNTEVHRFIDTLTRGGFLDDEAFRERMRGKHAAFAAAEIREAAYAGSGYPQHAAALTETLDRYHREGRTEAGESATSVIGVAAPHVSPFGGAAAYGAAYARLAAEHRERTFVILGTSHYGEPDKFGLTKKPFVTPYGAAAVDVEAVEFLARRAPSAVTMEDYAHSIEHSIEFQVVFLQHALRAPVRILPILCGPFFCNAGQLPEQRAGVQAFFDALRELWASRADELFWVLGIDLAHMGARYGDDFQAEAQRGKMSTVAAQDRARLERVCAGDAEGLFELAHTAHDDLKWCGTPPLYTFLRAVPNVRGQILRYDQWNIDPQSVVTFTGLELSLTE
ncbi:MAG: AmmeMemoRadiSam system protein B [Deltaproteobacteria bacterium]|nr:AmmeMemoRadiSam system protein B [Deltaproteobacteria bacterium]